MQSQSEIINNKGDDIIPLPISKDIYERISKRLSNTNFTSVEKYAEYVLDQVLSELEKLDREKSSPLETSTTSSETPFSKEEQESVEQNLRSLGYL
jgi:hypothetical protein